MVYEDIRPRNKERNVIERIKDMSENFINKLFNSGETQTECTCHALSSQASRSGLMEYCLGGLLPGTCAIGKHWLRVCGKDASVPALQQSYQKLQAKKADKKNVK